MENQQNAESNNFIPLPSTGEPSIVEIHGKVNQHTKDLVRQEKILNWTFGFIVAILVVCVIAFITFLIDAWRYHNEAYKENTTIIESLKKENQELKNDLYNQKLQILQNEINSLKLTPTSSGRG